MNIYIVVFALPMILSRIVPLTLFPVFWKNFADDMFLIGYNHTSNRDFGK